MYHNFQYFCNMNGIFSTAYAAPAQYYGALLTCDKKFLEVHEHFVKQTVRNRCHILTSNGVLVLTIPLHQRKNNMPVANVAISYKENWQRQHFKSLETAYKSSPFFEFYEDDLKEVYKFQPELLLQWNQHLHYLILKWLKLNINMEPSAEYIKESSDFYDFRKNDWNKKMKTPYHQVFENKFGFVNHLSIFDLLFHCGNQSVQYLMF